jgi:hypothetical protein
MTAATIKTRKVRNVKGNGTGHGMLNFPHPAKRESLPFLIQFLDNKHRREQKPLPVCRPMAAFVKEHLAKKVSLKIR